MSLGDVSPCLYEVESARTVDVEGTNDMRLKVESPRTIRGLGALSYQSLYSLCILQKVEAWESISWAAKSFLYSWAREDIDAELKH